MTSILEMINLQALMPYLHRHHLLTKHQTDMLLNSTLTEYHRKQELISILLSKGDEGCRRFLDAVSEEPEHLGHSEIAAMLTDPGNTAVVPNTGMKYIFMLIIYIKATRKKYGSFKCSKYTCKQPLLN